MQNIQRSARRGSKPGKLLFANLGDSAQARICCKTRTREGARGRTLTSWAITIALLPWNSQTRNTKLAATSLNEKQIGSLMLVDDKLVNIIKWASTQKTLLLQVAVWTVWITRGKLLQIKKRRLWKASALAREGPLAPLDLSLLSLWMRAEHLHTLYAPVYPPLWPGLRIQTRFSRR